MIERTDIKPSGRLLEDPKKDQDALAPEKQSFASSRKKQDNLVLIVDDERDIRELLSKLLEHERYDHMEAANGQEALDLLHNSPVLPCVILLDIMMPIMDGWRFRMLQRTDPDPEIANIPVIVLTAHATIEEVTRRMRATAALRKPFQIDNLLTTLDQACHA